MAPDGRLPAVTSRQQPEITENPGRISSADDSPRLDSLQVLPRRCLHTPRRRAQATLATRKRKVTALASDPAPAPDIRPGFRHLRRIYCAQRDGELLALALEGMTTAELVEVIGRLLARGAHTEAAELVAWMRGGAS